MHGKEQWAFDFWPLDFIYRMCAIINRSWFETALDNKPRILDP